MTTFVDSEGIRTIAAQQNGAGTNYLVETSAGILYQVYVDGNADVSFSKSIDSGKTWAAPVTIFTGTTTQLSVWFGPWSGLANGLIYCAYTESDTDDVLFRTINTASADALGTQTTIFAGASAGISGCLSITASRGGNLICAGCIDAGIESFSKKSTDAGANWGNIASPYEATTDQLILAPGFAADNQDILCIYWDADADEISRKVYDDSGDSWVETSIATSMTDLVAASAFPNFAIVPDLSNSRLILAAWSAVDLLNADLRCWFVSESAITETTTPIVSNSTDDQGLCAVSLDTTNGDIYVYYGGNSNGSSVWPNVLPVNYKKTDDGGATWGGETPIMAIPHIMTWLVTNPRMVYLSAELIVAFYNGIGSDYIQFSSIMPALPAVADVENGVQYGINGVQFTGTFAGGGTNSNANILGGSVIH